MKRLLLRAACGLLVPSAVASSCGGGFSAGAPEAGPGEGGVADVTAADVSAEEASPAPLDASHADGPADAAPATIVYVSPNGADTSTGLSQLSPKRTIASALAEASTLPGLPEVHVCAGSYSETKLSVSTDVVLEGAYDCATWTRTAGYGFPTFDGVNATSLENAEVSAQAATLTVSGAVTSLTVVDGFVIDGGSSSSLETAGVHVGGGASPVVRNDVVSGGSGAGGTTATGSIGVLVDGTSAPEITACFIDGGSGSGVEGSIGVDLDTTGAVNLHDASVSGGTGTLATATGPFATLGVRVRASLSSAMPLSELVVTATGANGTTGKTAGVYVVGSGVSAGIVLSDVSGGTSTASQAFGVYVAASGGTVTLLDDRVFGGVAKASSTQAYGVYASSAGTLLVANSMIHAGTVSANVGSYAVGVDLSNVASPGIVFDTIYTGDSAGTAIALNTGVTGAQIVDDLLVGSDSSLGTNAVATTSCSGLIGSLSYTGFANVTLLYQCPQADGGAVLASSVAALTAALGSAATGDVGVQATCGSSSSCAAVPGCPAAGEGCQGALFGPSWSDDGLSIFVPPAFGDGGPATADWALASGSPCALTKGGIPVPNVTTDVDGHPRSASAPSLGAVEYGFSTPCH